MLRLIAASGEAILQSEPAIQHAVTLSGENDVEDRHKRSKPGAMN